MQQENECGKHCDLADTIARKFVKNFTSHSHGTAPSRFSLEKGWGFFGCTNRDAIQKI
jgi:hypothetical protein